MLPRRATFYVLIITGITVTALSKECDQRDEVAAGRDCERACRADGTCRKQSRECVCDGLCGLSCLRKRCPPLEAPLNGNMVISPAERTIGAEVTYSCNNGYVISGSVNQVCQANKTWSETSPICIESIAEGSCDENDLSVDDWQIEFTYPGGSGHDAQPTRMKPPGTLARLKCGNFGFSILGSNAKVCRGGEWHVPEPSCERITCSVETIANGFVTRDGGDPFTHEASQGDWRRFTCEQGYTIVGEERSICHFGEWIPEKPTCAEEMCPAVENNGDYAHIFYQGVISQDTSFPPGTTLEVDCAEGRVLEGPVASVCRRGSWDPPRLLCVDNYCPAVANNGEYARIFYQGVTSQDTSFQPGTTLEVECAEGRVLKESTASVCRRGSWDPPKIICVQVGNCPAVTNNGEYARIFYQGVTSQDTSFPPGTTVEVDCAEGRVPEEPTTSVCRRGSWDPPRIPCVQVGCLNRCEIPPLENGYFTSYGTSEPLLQPTTCVEPGRHVIVNCQSGLYRRGSHYYTCRSSGEWFKPGGDSKCHLCRGRECVVPHIQNGYYSSTRSGIPLVSGTCTYIPYLFVACDNNTQLVGSHYYHCRDGELVTRNDDNALSICIRV